MPKPCVITANALTTRTRTPPCRESDYAILTRDFEDHVDDKVLEAVKNATVADAASAAASATGVTAMTAPGAALAPVPTATPVGK